MGFVGFVFGVGGFGHLLFFGQSGGFSGGGGGGLFAVRWGSTNVLTLSGIPDDESARLLLAMALGWKPGLTNEISQPFMRTGTLHVFAKIVWNSPFNRFPSSSTNHSFSSCANLRSPF